jgi:hypothetical protein
MWKACDRMRNSVKTAATFGRDVSAALVRDVKQAVEAAAEASLIQSRRDNELTGIIASPKNCPKQWDTAHSMPYNWRRMKVPKPIAAVLLFGVTALTSYSLSSGSDNAERDCESPTAFSPAEILRNMPVNSDLRCVGISLVAGALLEGQMLVDDAADDPATLGRQIFDDAPKKSVVRYHSRLLLEDGAAPIQSREALERLSTAVADLYKQRHQELIATDKGRYRLRAAMSKVVKSSAELDAVLDADPDRIDTFFCVGMRRFPDGTFKDTNHAILIAKNQAGEKIIYDPNDPGEAIPCRLQDIGDGVEVTWKCRYRDTSQVTTQRYQILAKDTFFRLALAKE